MNTNSLIMKSRENIQRFLAFGLTLCAGAQVAWAQPQIYTWTTIAGQPGVNGTNNGTGSAALFTTPTGITVDGSGNVYVADYGNNLVRKLTPNGTSSNWAVATIAGKLNPIVETDGSGTAAAFMGPVGIAVDSGGYVYVADDSGTSSGGPYSLRKLSFISGAWNVSTIFRYNTIGGPFGLALDNGGNLLLTLKTANEIERVVPQGQTWSDSIIAGPDGLGNNYPGSADGTNFQARFRSPSGICGYAGTNVYVADANNDTIRKTTRYGTNWVTTTIVGQVQNYGNVDGLNNTAQLYGPSGLATDASGTIFVADENNNTIRKIAPQGTNWVVTTIGGQLNGSPGHLDGIGVNSSFNHPAGIAVDNAGNVYVADFGNNIIRMGVPSPATNPPPSLQLATGGGAAFVMWPLSNTNFAIQTATSPAGPWQTATGGVTTNLIFCGSMTNSHNFYRLVQQ